MGNLIVINIYKNHKCRVSNGINSSHLPPCYHEISEKCDIACTCSLNLLVDIVCLDVFLSECPGSNGQFCHSGPRPTTRTHAKASHAPYLEA